MSMIHRKDVKSAKFFEKKFSLQPLRLCGEFPGHKTQKSFP